MAKIVYAGPPDEDFEYYWHHPSKVVYHHVPGVEDDVAVCLARSDEMAEFVARQLTKSIGK